MVYLLFSILVLAISYKLFCKSAGTMSLSQINMISWIFYVELLTYSYIGSLIIVNNLEEGIWFEKIYSSSNFDSKFYAWLSIQYAMIAMPLGMMFMTYLWGKKKNSYFENFSQKKVELKFLSDKVFKSLLVLLSFFSFASIIYTFFCIGFVPIFHIASFDFYELAKIRNAASIGFTGNTLIRDVLGRMLTPILTYTAFIYFCQNRKFRDFFWFVVMLLATFFILTYDLSKSPLVFFGVGFLFVRVLLGHKIGWKIYASIGVFSLVILMLAYGLLMGVDSNSDSFERILRRIFTMQAAGVFASFELFPNKIGFLGFSSISRSLSSSLDIGFSPPSIRMIMLHLVTESDSVGVMNSLFVGEAWANWGVLGVVFTPIYVGMLIQGVFLYLLSCKKTPFLVGIISYFSYRTMITGGFNQFLYSTIHIAFLLLWVAVYLLDLLIKSVIMRTACTRLADSHLCRLRFGNSCLEELARDELKTTINKRP